MIKEGSIILKKYSALITMYEMENVFMVIIKSYQVPIVLYLSSI